MTSAGRSRTGCSEGRGEPWDRSLTSVGVGPSLITTSIPPPAKKGRAIWTPPEFRQFFTPDAIPHRRSSSSFKSSWHRLGAILEGLAIIPPNIFGKFGKRKKKVVSLRSRWLQGQIMQCTCENEELWVLSTQVNSFSTLSLCFSGKFLCLITPQAERSCLVARFSWGMLLSRQGWLLSTQRSEGGRGWVCAGKDNSTPPLSLAFYCSRPLISLSPSISSENEVLAGFLVLSLRQLVPSNLILSEKKMSVYLYLFDPFALLYYTPECQVKER